MYEALRRHPVEGGQEGWNAQQTVVWSTGDGSKLWTQFDIDSGQHSPLQCPLVP